MKKLLLFNTHKLAAHKLAYSVSYIQFPLREIAAGTLLAFRVILKMRPIEELLMSNHNDPIKFPGHLTLHSTEHIQLFDKQGVPVDSISSPFENMMEIGNWDLYKAGFLLEVKKDLDPTHSERIIPNMNWGK